MKPLRAGFVMASVIALTFVAVVAQAVIAPGRALACSCMEPMPTLAQVAVDPQVVVVAGTIGPQTPERTPLEVSTWFHGPNPQPMIWLGFGSQMISSCDPFVTPGEQRLMVLSLQGEGVYSVNPCVAETGVIGTESGDAGVAAAYALFGGGQAPQSPEPTASPPTSVPQPGGDSSMLFVVGVIGAGLLVLAAAFVFATVRRKPTV